MRRWKKAMLIAFGGLGIAAIGAVAAWVYVTSNVEQPKYDVVQADGDIERRAYPAMVAAEIETRGGRQAAVRAGFGPLARYIFARERQGDKIAMTAPVTQRAGAGNAWTVQFIMPSEYRIEDLPKPVRDGVHLSEMPARERVAIRFSGVADDALIAEKETQLRAWMERAGLTPDGAPIYAYYNDPLTPGFLRRNEVMFDLAP